MESKSIEMKLKNYIKLGMGLILLSMLQSCQEEFIPETSGETSYVVEGFVEAGEDSNPTYVLITQSVPFFSEIGQDVFSNLFVNDAKVSVNDGDKTVDLTSLCLSDLPEEFRDEFVSQLGIESDSLEVDFCIYLDIFDEITREVGRSYDLTIEIGEDLITGSTTIPTASILDSIWFEEIPGDPIDTLAQMWCTIQDEPGVSNFYRYFTDDGTGAITAPFSSVTDDVVFDGQAFEFPISKAESPNAEFDINTFGFFRVGDTTTLKWCTIDPEHYDFWSTFEFNLNNQGPFASYTRVNHNLDGALGIWGGYAVDNTVIVVEK